ncbi:alpha beta-hydrolase [Epithele typhae]|uniref:alpha beta-hydrolase n=1 Tax=Epithele typhae TaxID=378194 RepID=UPI0020083E1D|nr:alpha beta-hydrolase [Epithele typhae]KAH9922812.1 alpha beta-hydrolase [Epithele typhae]
MRFHTISLLALAAASTTMALPRPRTKRATTAVSASDLAGFAPFTQFARAAYCDSDKIEGWKCGEACDAIPGFEPTLTGGDGNAVQLFFVGYWPDQNSVVISHEGTDPTALMSDLTDLKFTQENLDSTLFPDVSTDVKAHNGFADEHAKTAAAVLAETTRLLSDKNANQVIVIGHSLGGAIAELDSLYLTLNLPADVHVKGVTYGTPRVGNQAFVDLFDSKVADFTRVNNEHDMVPIVPGRFLGFSHPKGEVHITSPGNAVACSGDDNDGDAECTDKTVSNILKGSVLDHLGPYEGIHIGSIFCN